MTKLSFTSQIFSDAKQLYEYQLMHHQPKPVDVIFVLGSHDLRVAERAAELYEQSFSSTVIISGGMAHIGDLLETGWNRTEAEEFADVMIQNGVPKEKLLLEKEARNTGDNFRLSGELLKKKNIEFGSALVVTKPYMERRAYATGKVHWPEVDLVLASPDVSFEEYVEGSLDQEAFIHIMVGDIQRMVEYPARGFQIYQEVPDKVLAAYDRLVTAGFNKHLIT